MGRHRSPLFFPDPSSLEDLEEADFEDEILHSDVHTPTIKRFLVKVLQAQCQLVPILTDVATLLFPTSDYTPGSSTKYEKLAAKVEKISEALSSWKTETLPSLSSEDSQQYQPVKVFVNLTLMYYQ